MKLLSSIASHDVDGSVRLENKKVLIEIKEWINEWFQQPLKIPIKPREKMIKKEEKVLEMRI